MGLASFNDILLTTFIPSAYAKSAIKEVFKDADNSLDNDEGKRTKTDFYKKCTGRHDTRGSSSTTIEKSKAPRDVEDLTRVRDFRMSSNDDNKETTATRTSVSR